MYICIYHQYPSVFSLLDFAFPPLNYFQCRHVTTGVLEADDETNTYATFVQETYATRPYQEMPRQHLSSIFTRKVDQVASIFKHILQISDMFRWTILGDFWAFLVVFLSRVVSSASSPLGQERWHGVFRSLREAHAEVRQASERTRFHQ